MDSSGFREPSSFRDPSGFVFRRNGVLYRQINRLGAADFDALEGRGIFQEAAKRGFLLPFEAVDEAPLEPGQAARVIRPTLVPFISYPYEWSFTQLKQAALLTIDTQRWLIEQGASLKDASAYNVQFFGNRPVLIDHVSVVSAEPGHPWVAYRQFCEHFLAPLALMAYRDIRLSQLLRVHLDGVPLDEASRLLPWRTRLSTGLLAHIHFHARNQRVLASSGSGREVRIAPSHLRALLNHLRETVERLRWEPRGTEWAEYYDHTNYSDIAAQAKERLVQEWAGTLPSGRVLDLGANTGVYSRAVTRLGRSVVAVDNDPAAVERLVRGLEGELILPLVVDVVNPSPALGWGNEERQSFLERAPSQLVLGLALIHHLAISNNTPLDAIARLFARLGDFAIVEFVPKTDSQVQKLFRSRPDIFPEYTIEGFERAFAMLFRIRAAETLPESERRLYFFERR